MGYWMDNAMEEGKHILIDLGYAGNEKTRNHCDAITKIISKKNVEIVYCGRVLVRIPPSKLKMIMEKFPDIEERQTYAWCTHVWVYEDMSNLEYALK